MKKLIVLLALLIWRAPLAAPDVCGVWDMVLKASWTTPVDLVCTFKQDDPEN